MTLLNMIVAKQLKEFKLQVDSLIKDQKLKKDDAVFNVLREYIRDSKRIRFEGDGYGEAWEKESKKRKLSNNKTTPEALKIQMHPNTIKLYEEMGVMNKIELEARHAINLEEYSKHIQIEGRVLGDIARNHVIPTAIRYQNILIKNVKGLKEIYGDSFKNYGQEQLNIIEQISHHIEQINSGITAMIDQRKKANKLEDLEKRAEAYCFEVKPFFEKIRYHCDKLELLVDDEIWTLTKYREMLLIH